jgi:penicillin-binding protein 1B
MKSMGKWLLAGIAVLAIAVVAVAGLIAYSAVELARFSKADVRRSTFVYAAPQTLRPGVNVERLDLGGTLGRLRYTESRTPPSGPGQYQRTRTAWDIYLRGVEGIGPVREVHRVRVELRGDRVARLTRDGVDVSSVSLEPEVITSVGDTPREEFRPVQLAEVPLTLLNAVLAAEDHRFFDHVGLDVHALARAAWANLRARKVRQGGSTITQQLVKNRLLSSERTFARKASEAWLAALVEWRYPKAQILEAYLNEIYLGQRGSLAIRGVGAASRAYFAKELHQLTLGEAALLVGMIRAPNSYSPAINPGRARERRDVVLARMHELKMISADDLAAARAEPVRLPQGPQPTQLAPYFADYVRQEVEQLAGEDIAEGRGSKVFTTLDVALQRYAETALIRGLDRLEARFPRLRRSEPTARLQGAIVVLDPLTGHVRALVGGRDYQVSQYNRALLARRQPGSAFKPFVYLAALRPQGGQSEFTPASFLDDSPLTLTVNGKAWTPRNYEDRYEGRVTVRRALEQSLNAATIRLAQAAGLRNVVTTARGLGVEADLAPVPSLALGAFEMTPIALARAYVPFANGGRRTSGPAVINAIYDGARTPLALPASAAVAAITGSEAYLMTSLMQGVINSGTGAQARALGVPGDVAGKTGTTNDGRDAWFVGYSTNLLAAVWVGFDSNEPHGLPANQAALPIWADFMKQALEAYPAGQFTVPAGVSFVTIDATNGRRATRFCPLTARETFLAGTEPGECTEHGGVVDTVVDWWQRLRGWFR